MQFKALTLAALSAVALAHVEERQMATDPAAASVLLVLATAIPPESISVATANPAAFSAELASSLSAGKTPEWYQALPSDVKSYLPKLYPASTPATPTPASSTPAPSSSAVSSAGTISASPTGGNHTVVSTVSSATLRSTGGANSQAPSSSVATGGAANPTAVLGAGVAGAIGLLGILAL